MDFWDGWKLSYLTQAFTNQPASLTGTDMGSAKEIASGKTPYSSSYRSASFTEQTLVWEARTLLLLFPLLICSFSTNVRLKLPVI
jgi:hypothetical protein